MFFEEYNHSNLQKYIYIFDLVEDKRFIYSSFPKEESRIILEATLYYDYLKKYPILRIADKREQRTGFDIDGHTKEYMYFYGFNNVRGGSYSEEFLTKSQEEIIQSELKTFDNADQKPKEYFITLILEDYKDRLLSKKDVDDEISRISKKHQQYIFEKKRLSKYKKCSLWIYTFGDHINCLKEQCYHLHKRTYDSIGYKKLIQRIKIISSLVAKNFPELLEKDDSENGIYYKYPEFAFDNYIYKVKGKCSLETISRICNRLIYFGDFLLNRIHEYEFDISSYGFEDEWTFSRRLYYLSSYSC